MLFQLFQINVTLHDSFTTNDIVKCPDDYDIHFMRQTFDCTHEAAKKLQTRLELLISIRASENQVLSLPEFIGIMQDYDAWIDRSNFNDRRYLDCVANSPYI